MTAVHATAVVDPQAELHPSVSVGPYAVIGPHVKIGAGTTVGPHAVIEGHTTIGQDNRIFQFASIGAIPQDKKYDGEPCELVIGDRNTIREFVTFNIGSPGGGAVTRIGSDNWIMAYVHIAHDCIVGDHCTMANNTTLGGHVTVGDWVTIGGLCGIHQFTKVGAHAMVGFASAVSQDVPPFLLVDGNPLRVAGVNVTGLKRRDFSDERIRAIRQMHKLLYREGRTLADAREAIAELALQVPAASADAALMGDFLAAAERGIAR
ncbi:MULTISPECIES: acyl-ACP--UDP-N-acetylglucosamine O-acyltransferase [Ramlibacter]|uniref:Acyl-[acyl-carrier-protein]--UDP-N-acetylglucosamine O-acyltransferase n=1 Tax=Ramlibacter aquaticus TaxID=2780094 RepID=A0ABR9SG09_9BURK|nr:MULTISPECIES: acyl-ACP--UDP-N-acetylglucosamine O-acyltransferase [Ramlibacter]MBE7941266.1 acyl-ACP--UDP-N-acetylglucosamine O-acyltransferase [Ramlibacter aquaticus]